MRVGLLTTSFPRSPSDTAGRFVHGFAHALIDRGFAIDVLAPEPRERIAPGVEPGLAVTHVRYLWPRALERTFYGAGVPENLARDLLAWLGPVPFTLALARRARLASKGWDAVVSHWALPCGLVAAGIAPAKPHLAVLHSADVHALCHLPYPAAWARRIARGSTAMWFVTRAHRERFVRLLPEPERDSIRARTLVAPMGLELPETTDVDRERARRDLSLTQWSVLALGRLVPIKGLDVLLRASRDRPWTLLIAGDGPERGRLEAEARRLRVDARFFGEVAGARKSLLLTAADALALPSRVLPSGRTEGMPVALLEAMAFGLPIVASAVGGITEIVEHSRTGLLVAPDRADELTDALDRLSLDPSLRKHMAKAARLLAEQQGWSRVIEPAVAVLSSLHRQAEITPTP